MPDILTEQEMRERLDRHSAHAPEPQDDGAQELLNGIRREGHIAQESQLAEIARKREADARTDRLRSETDSNRAHAEALKSEAELAKEERERSIQVYADRNHVPLDVAAAELGYVQPRPLVPAQEQKSDIALLDQFITLLHGVRSLDREMEEKVLARYAPKEGAAAVPPAAVPSLIEELQKWQDTRRAVVAVGEELGLIPRERAQQLVAQPAPHDTIVDLTKFGVGQVPASMALEIYKIEKDHERALHEIDERFKAEGNKWNVIQQIKEMLAPALDFREWGKALAGSSHPQPTPQSSSALQGGAPRSAMMRLTCPECQTPTVLATRDMVLAGATAICTRCNRPFGLTANIPEPPSQPAQRPAQAPSDGAADGPPVPPRKPDPGTYEAEMNRT